MTEKRCTGCKLIKPLDEFYIEKRNLDKRCSRCKKCQLEEENQRYKTNPLFRQRKREAAHLWGKNNPEKMRIFSRHYAKKNPEKVRKAVLRSHKTHPETLKLWKKK